jgi:hypothetical protein
MKFLIRLTPEVDSVDAAVRSGRNVEDRVVVIAVVFVFNAVDLGGTNFRSIHIPNVLKYVAVIESLCG